MFKYIVFILLSYSFFCGAQTKNQTDAKGLKQGYWEKTDDNKKVVYKGTFKDDKPQGLFYYYYKNSDSLHTKTEFKQNGQIAYVTMHHLKTGKIQAKGKYVNEEKDSTWNFYDETGALISTENYIKGKRNGPSKVFYDNGVVSEEKSYKNGKEDGPFKLFYDDKKLKAEGNYANGEYNGKCSWYFPNGVAAAQGYYVKGIKNAVWVYKTQDGKITDKEVWQNGKQLSPKEADAFFKSKNPPLKEEPKATDASLDKTKNNTPSKK